MTDPHDTQHLPAIDTTGAQPPKPTLASLIVDRLVWIETATERTGNNLNDLYVKHAQSVTEARFLALVAIGVASLTVLLDITLIVLVAWLVGHVR